MGVGLEPIDKDGGFPLYLQIEERIRRGIAQGAWRVGDLLPTEEEMCRAFGVSRGPVRQALAKLVSAGIIKRERRNGTRVVRGIDSRGLILVTPFTAIQTAGLKATARILMLRVVSTPRQVAARWGTPPGHLSVRFERVFLGNDTPVAYADSYLPADRFAAIIGMNLASTALMDVLSQQFGVTLTRLDHSMELAELPDYQADLLGLPRHSEGLHVSLCQWEGQEPVEHVELWLEPAKSRFLIAGLLALEPDSGKKGKGRAHLG
ncbi:MAG: GntR family transcriptional regulator [Bacillota bacterium]|nr:GntR family transcriptional regulator [Bacillota bacterium]